MARHDTSKAPDELEEMRVKIGKMEVEEVEAKAEYRDSLNKLESYQEQYRGKLREQSSIVSYPSMILESCREECVELRPIQTQQWFNVAQS